MKPEDLGEVVERLKDFGSVHSVLLFGSRARDEADESSDIDVCVVEDPGTDLTLDEKLEVSSEIPEKIDISFFHDMPINIRARVLREGKILYTRDKYHVYNLIKETNFELPKYRKFQEGYHRQTRKKVKKKVS